ASIEPVVAFASEEAVVAALAVEDVVAAFAEHGGDIARHADGVGTGRADDRRPDGFRAFGAARSRGAAGREQQKEAWQRNQGQEPSLSHPYVHTPSSTGFSRTRSVSGAR